MSMDKSAILAELERLQQLRQNKRQNGDVSESNKASYEYMISFFATILEENEDILYGLFWDEYNKLLVVPEPERRFVRSWYMYLFEGVVQKVTPRAVRFAGSLLLDPHYPLRDFVAERLGEMGSLDAYKYLVSVVLDEEDFQIASRAALSLGEIGAVQAEPLLVYILNDNTHTNMADYERGIIQGYALEGLVWLDTPTAWEAIKTLAVQCHFNEYLRSDAVRFLGYNKGTEVIPLLQSLASDESKEVRDTAIYYLKKSEGTD